MWIAWPAFLVAGVVEMVVFAFVDPQQLHGFDGEPLALSRPAVYTVSFFTFWFAAMASSALTTLLALAVRGEPLPVADPCAAGGLSEANAGRRPLRVK